MKSVRSKPFGEWNIVYYMKTETTPAKILTRLRQKGCKNATWVQKKDAADGPIRAVARSPIVTAGDIITVSTLRPKGSKLEIDCPDGWKRLATSVMSKGNKRTVATIQTPRGVKTGVYELTVRVTKGEQKWSLKVPVEIVRRVK